MEVWRKRLAWRAGLWRSERCGVAAGMAWRKWQAKNDSNGGMKAKKACSETFVLD